MLPAFEPVRGSVESNLQLTEGDYGDTVTALLEDGKISPLGALEKNGMTSQSGIFGKRELQRPESGRRSAQLSRRQRPMSGQSSQFSSHQRAAVATGLMNRSMSKPAGIISGRSAGGAGTMFGVYGQNSKGLESQRQSSGSALGISVAKQQQNEAKKKIDPIAALNSSIKMLNNPNMIGMVNT